MAYQHPFDSKQGVPLYFGGHCFYTRKCMTGEQLGDNFRDREVGGILLPQVCGDESQFVDVIAVGATVGQTCLKKHANKFRGHSYDGLPPRRFPDIIKVGDRLLCPNESIGIKRTDLCDAVGNRIMYEHFIEESIPMAIKDDTCPHGLRPWGDRCLLEILPEEEVGGIIMVDPDIKADRARVLSVGCGTMYPNGAHRVWPMHPGDEVLIMKKSGIPVSFDLGQKNLKICNSIEIEAIMSTSMEEKEVA